jgi:DNA-binding NtrC family response regulator
MTEEILKGKVILAVDDEEDVLAVISEQLQPAVVHTAINFEEAKAQLKKEKYHLIILDIMGVRGFDLLEITGQMKTPTVMLTAHSMSPESFQKSIDFGAVSFLPKEELVRLREFVEEILEGVDRGETHWSKLSQRLGPRFRQLWGELWDEIRLPPDNKISW